MRRIVGLKWSDDASARAPPVKVATVAEREDVSEGLYSFLPLTRTARTRKRGLMQLSEPRKYTGKGHLQSILNEMAF